jgi:dinuclear metal center YbgI/SA1388 family protein
VTDQSLAAVLDVVERLWPLSGTESWDAVGLISGDPSATVSRIMLTVDASLDTADDAVEAGAQLLLAHHPLLLRGVTSVAEDRYKGAIIARLIRADCALLAAHTNADVVARGTSAVLAARIGIVDATPIVPAADGLTGLGRVGQLSEPMTLGRLARLVSEILPPTAGGVRVAGDYSRLVSRVAVTAGAGDSLLSHPEVLASDVYVTSDLRHHPAQEAKEAAQLSGGPALIDVSHWASEWLWCDAAAEELRAALPDVEVVVSERRTDPWDFMVVQ